jgi:polar amino acid transport system substrate-binding protein
MRNRRAGYFLLIFASSALVLGCDFPHDQRGTLQHIASERRIRVGLVENKPWVARSPNGDPSGVEVELVKSFAAELGAAPEWRWENEADAMEALIDRELDIVLGGLTEQTRWKDEVGLSSSYFTDHIVVGAPPSGQLPSEIDGKEVLVEADDLAAQALVAEQNGRPVRTETLIPTALAAGRDWHLERLGFRLSQIDLRKDKHVMAVAPGENGFLVRLETLLESRRNGVKGMLLRNAKEGG